MKEVVCLSLAAVLVLGLVSACQSGGSKPESGAEQVKSDLFVGTVSFRVEGMKRIQGAL